MSLVDIDSKLDELLGMSRKGSSSSRRKNLISPEERLKIRANAEKKYRDDALKAEKAYADKLEDYKKKKAKESFRERAARLKEEYDMAIGFQQKLSAFSKSLGNNLAEAASKAVKTSLSKVNKGINEYLGAYTQYMSGIETRLQGSAKTFSSVTGVISSAVGSSQYVSQRKVLENLSELVKKGIAYNVEQRAFLATVSDRIATTFDAFDSNLARIIRIQQADSTAARLGLESQLTKFFNNTFGDTSYLSTVFDTVSASLLSASSTMNRDKSVAFEYTVQKWLGSLSSVGVSDSTIQQLAQGIGYLASGDINSLAGNQSLQNLLVMASSRAGIDYGSMLTGGMTSADASTLLKSVIQFAQDISNTNNRVVLSQYAKIFGMDISDLMAISNLTAKDLVTISSNMLEYEKLYSETESQIKTLGSRMSIKNRIDTMFENIMSSIGENIANSAGSYTTWLLTDIVEEATGGIAIPTIGAFGNFIDLETTVTGLIKTGIVGISTISELGNILAGLSGANKLSLSNWGSSDMTTRGNGFTGLVTTGATKTVSESRFVGNADESAIYEGSVAAAKDEAAASYNGTNDEDSMEFILKNRIASSLETIVDILNIDGVVVRYPADDIISKVKNNIGG